jgi:hypothetical protein
VTDEESLRRVELVVDRGADDLGQLLEAASTAPGVRSAVIAP